MGAMKRKGAQFFHRTRNRRCEGRDNGWENDDNDDNHDDEEDH